LTLSLVRDLVRVVFVVLDAYSRGEDEIADGNKSVLAALVAYLFGRHGASIRNLRMQSRTAALN